MEIPARATHEKTTDIPLSGNLLSPPPNTDFRDYLEEMDELISFAPEITDEILIDHKDRKKRRPIARTPL